LADSLLTQMNNRHIIISADMVECQSPDTDGK